MRRRGWAWLAVGLATGGFVSCSSDERIRDRDGRGGSSGASGAGTALIGGDAGNAARPSGGADQGGASGSTGAGTSNGGGGTGAGAEAGVGADGGEAGSAGDGEGGSVGGMGGTGGSGGAGSDAGGSGGSGGCVGLECQVVSDACPSSSPTTLTGTVYAPDGALPLHNASVWVPTVATALPPVPEGVECRRCSDPPAVARLTRAVTSATGAFRLEGVPSGSNVPLVIELGKWRRVVAIPSVAKCVDNPLENPDLTRLPRTQAEGHIPRIAITTGGSDALECLPRRLGVADGEVGTDGSAARVHLYAGGNGTNSFAAGGAFAPATALWSNPTKLASYDAILHSCEGSASQFADQKPQTSIDNLTAYTNAGGRLFFGHLHSYWLRRMADISATATYVSNLDPPPDGIGLTVNQAFSKGAAFAQWLTAVGASSAPGVLNADGSEHSVTAVTPPTREWLFLEANPQNGQRSAQYLTFNTPVTEPAAMQCGRVGFADLHFNPSVAGGGGDNSDPDVPYPTGCASTPMSPQGKALAFLLFDLTNCVEPDG